MRIGQGFDLHILVEGRELVLGGVNIPFEMGLKGYSDGDALLHAVIDAVLGGLALGNIGTHFPSDDPRWKDADSKHLLAAVIRMMKERGYHLSNLDSTVFADLPALSPWLSGMSSEIAQAFCVEDSAVSVKAKSLEGLVSLLPHPVIAAAAVVVLDEDQKSGANDE